MVGKGILEIGKVISRLFILLYIKCIILSLDIPYISLEGLLRRFRIAYRERIIGS